MLAPLEDRRLLSRRGCDEECAVEKEMQALRRALRASRLRLRRERKRGYRGQKRNCRKLHDTSPFLTKIIFAVFD